MSNRIKLILMTIIMLFIPLITSCNNLENTSYILAYDLSTEATNLDPQTAVDESSLLVISNIFDGLFGFDDDGKIYKVLADDIELSSDELVYTIKMREDSYWSNGEPVQANDFVYAFQRVVDPNTNSFAKNNFMSIKNAPEIIAGELAPTTLGVKAISTYTIQIELSQPNDNLIEALASSYSLPCNEEFFLSTKGKYGLEVSRVLSNGVFELTTWRKGEVIRISKNYSHYDAANILPAQINLHVKTTEDTIQRLLQNDIHSTFVKAEDIDFFTGSRYTITPVKSVTWGLVLNHNNQILSNLNIRQAIASCFDRSSYDRYVTENLTTTTSIIPNEILLFDDYFRDISNAENLGYKFDTDIANEYLRIGTQELEFESIKVLNLIVNKDLFPNLIQFFAYPSQIFQEELSLFINVEELSTAEYNKRISSRNFDIAFTEINSSDNTIANIFNQFKTGNYFGYSSQEFEDMLDLAISGTNKEETQQNYILVEKILLDEVAIIPMLNKHDYFVEAVGVSGHSYNEKTGLISFKSAKMS